MAACAHYNRGPRPEQDRSSVDSARNRAVQCPKTRLAKQTRLEQWRRTWWRHRQLVNTVNRRVVVTGLGMITPVGNDMPATWESLCAGRSGIARITRFDTTGYRAQIAGEVKDFDPLHYFDSREARRMDRVIQLALVAAAEAV